MSVPQIVVFSLDWAEPHDGTGEGGEARVYTLDAASIEWASAPQISSTEDVLDALHDGDERLLHDLIFYLDQDHTDYVVNPQARDWPQHWVIRIAPGGTSIRVEPPYNPYAPRHA